MAEEGHVPNPQKVNLIRQYLEGIFPGVPVQAKPDPMTRYRFYINSPAPQLVIELQHCYLDGSSLDILLRRLDELDLPSRMPEAGVVCYVIGRNTIEQCSPETSKQ